MVSLRQLRYLESLAETRHFGHAAEACAVSQPVADTNMVPYAGCGTWEDVYAGWNRSDGQYYWNQLKLDVVQTCLPHVAAQKLHAWQQLRVRTQCGRRFSPL